LSRLRPDKWFSFPIGAISLRWKILSGYLVIAGLLLITGGWAIYNFIKLNQAIKDIMVASYRSVVASQNMVEALEKQDRAALLLLFGESRDSLKTFLANQQDFSKWYTIAEGNITYRGEPESLARIKNGYSAYLRLFEDFKALYRAGDPAAARRFYLTRLMPRYQQVKRAIHELLDINQNHMVTADERAKKDAQKAIYSTTLVSILALVLALIFGYKIAAIIIKPTLRLTEGAKRIGEGQLDERIAVETRDEIGRLAEEFNRMTARLKEYDQNNIDRLITERRRADAIVRSIPDPLIVVDAGYRIIALNSAAEKVFGVQEKQVKNAHILEVITTKRSSAS
jgi:methyl-accepting chemotaxis protein